MNSKARAHHKDRNEAHNGHSNSSVRPTKKNESIQNVHPKKEKSDNNKKKEKQHTQEPRDVHE
jgi:hypothetical protein